MGSIIGAYCSCGYVKEMALGGGMRNFTTHCNFPFFCEECSILFEENLFEEHVSCPKCKSTKVTPYDKKCKEEGALVFEWVIKDRVLILTNGKHICPKCGDYSLVFGDAGCFD